MQTTGLYLGKVRQNKPDTLSPSFSPNPKGIDRALGTGQFAGWLGASFLGNVELVSLQSSQPYIPTINTRVTIIYFYRCNLEAYS
jgi:hypothetical protein